MIDLGDYTIFSDNPTTLKEASVDRRDPTTVSFMTESLIKAVDLDEVKNTYVRPLSLSSVPSSADALLTDSNGTLLFIEFKNGVMSSKKQHDVLKKAYDSVLIFNDITSTTISELRGNAEFILVYNDAVNEESKDPELLKKKEACVQPSPAFTALAKTVSGYANREFICFGLSCLKNYCFKAVHTYTELEFDTYLVSHNLVQNSSATVN